MISDGSYGFVSQSHPAQGHALCSAVMHAAITLLPSSSSSVCPSSCHCVTLASHLIRMPASDFPHCEVSASLSGRRYSETVTTGFLINHLSTVLTSVDDSFKFIILCSILRKNQSFFFFFFLSCFKSPKVPT